MPEALSDAQWAGIRELLEGEPPTHERVARAANVYVKSISLRAGKDGWRTLDFRFGRVRTAHRAMIQLAAMARAGEELDPVEEPEIWGGAALPAPAESGREGEGERENDETPQERLARIGEMLTRQTEELLRRADSGRPIEARQVQALAGLVKISEHIAVLAETDAVERQQRSDEELAGMLEKIDDRIIYLACTHAQRILAQHGIVDEEVERQLATDDESTHCPD
jgi:hypothetical protein